MNLQNCFIRRVQNGWIVCDTRRDFGEISSTEFVFTSSASLAKFIAENFYIPKLEKKEN